PAALLSHVRVLGARPAGHFDPVRLHEPGPAGGPADRRPSSRRSGRAAGGGGLRGGAAVGGARPADRAPRTLTKARERTTSADSGGTDEDESPDQRDVRTNAREAAALLASPAGRRYGPAVGHDGDRSAGQCPRGRRRR